jgi:hypothetical protein
MLHPELGPSRDPIRSWAIDTDEIQRVLLLCATHFDVDGQPDQIWSRLGFLWTKLGGATRLAHLAWEYAELKWTELSKQHTQAAPRQTGWNRWKDAYLGHRRESPNRSAAFPEREPLYDRWLDA